MSVRYPDVPGRLGICKGVEPTGNIRPASSLIVSPLYASFSAVWISWTSAPVHLAAAHVIVYVHGREEQFEGDFCVAA
ncbi:MAG: hypothetical protein KIT09_17420 [Bryobacteraceae bacterium]|nr:hypothetical protein [Bryobacteraceae bacterium]